MNSIFSSQTTYKNAMSETASTSVTNTGNDSLTLAEEIKKYKTKELIDFLCKEGDLELEEEDLKIIRKQRVTGYAFFDLTQEELERWEMLKGPAKTLIKFAKECKEKKKRAFFSYRSLKKVLAKYGINSNGTETIPLFSLQTHEIQDSNKHFKHCMENILFRMNLWLGIVWSPCEA
jgi:hypothetical protein